MLLHLKNCVAVCLSVPAYTWFWYWTGSKCYSEMLKTIHSPSSVAHPSHSSNSDRFYTTLSFSLISGFEQVSLCQPTRNPAFLCLTRDICKRWLGKPFTEAAEHSGRSTWPWPKTPVSKSWLFHESFLPSWTTSLSLASLSLYTEFG